ncbi:MAG: hypothetical protein ACP5G1_03890 [Nanopusillaceae archaeon]
MQENEQKFLVYWKKSVGGESLKLDLKDLKDKVSKVFQYETDNYKQKLVYNLLETVKNNDQKEFFYILLKTINKPKEDYKELWEYLQKNFDIMPENIFVNFAYTLIISIMSTYAGEKNE